MRDGKRELEQSQARIKKLDEIIQRFYEDNIEGKISYERFTKMAANYEAEQHTLENRVAELKSTMTSEKESALGVDHFLALVRKYTDIKELTAEIIREFVEKIYVYKAERTDGDGYSVSKWFITVLVNLTPRFLHPPQSKKNRHSR
jgi:hypothetical protein